MPDGLPPSIDFGKVPWGADADRTIQLTWKHAAPYGVTIETGPGRSRAEVVASKVLPGRFRHVCHRLGSRRISSATDDRAATRSTPRSPIRWTSRDSTTVRAKGLVLYPAHVSASPVTLDLGNARLQQPVRGSIVLVSTAPADVTIEPTPWLQRVDGSGRVLDVPLKLATNVPVRVEFRVDWAPIAERGAKSFAAGRPVHATGRIRIRWNDREMEIPAEVVAAK